MPVVFIHGVSNRPGAEYEAGVASRNALIRRFLAPALGRAPDDMVLLNPLWGDVGAQSRWNYPWLPNAGVAALGTDPNESGAVAAEVATAGTATGESPILGVARSNGLIAAVDLLFEWNLVTNPDPTDSEAAALADAAYAAASYAASNDRPAWLAEVHSDSDLIERLQSEAENVAPAATEAALGLGEWWDHVRESADRLQNLTGHALGVGGVTLLRNFVHRNVAMFAGDLLVYVAHRGTRNEPGPIVEHVLKALREGQEKSSADDPLIILAHSLGGIVAYDILSHFAQEIEPKALVTVGSQVAIFEDLKIFMASDPTIGPGGQLENAPRPPNVGCWINVFDRADALSFDTADVFDGVEDYDYSSGLGADRAHGGYFVRPSFYLHLGERLATICK